MCARFTTPAAVDRRTALCVARDGPRNAVFLKRKRTHEIPILSQMAPAPTPKQPSLPQDCWSRIFSFLPAVSHGALQFTCRRFCKINLLPGSWPGILQGMALCDKDLLFFRNMPFTHVALGARSSVGVTTLSNFLQHPKRERLQALSVRNLEPLSVSSWHLSALQRLELHACGLQAEDVLCLCSPPGHLTSLDLSGNPFPDHALTKLNECPDLVALNLSGCKGLSNACLQHLTDNKLRVLALAGVKLLTDAGLLRLRQIPSLEALNLSNLKQITDAGILSLGEGLPLLQVLDLSLTHVTALSLLSRVSSIHLLCVLRCPALPVSTVLTHMPPGTRVVMEEHVFGERNPWLKQDLCDQENVN